MFISSIIALSIAVVTTSAIPLAARGPTCSPNFEGAGLRVTDSWTSELVFGVSTVAPFEPLGPYSVRGPGAVDWHFQQTGQPVVGYIIKDVDNNNLAVSARVDSSILLDVASDSGNAVDQIWSVECQTCESGISGLHGVVVASRCIIRSPLTILENGCIVMEDGINAYVSSSGFCTPFDFSTAAI